MGSRKDLWLTWRAKTTTSPPPALQLGDLLSTSALSDLVDPLGSKRNSSGPRRVKRTVLSGGKISGEFSACSLGGKTKISILIYSIYSNIIQRSYIKGAKVSLPQALSSIWLEMQTHSKCLLWQAGFELYSCSPPSVYEKSMRGGGGKQTKTRLDNLHIGTLALTYFWKKK